MQDYWLATFNKKNLTWESKIAGEKQPTNSYAINGLLVGRNHGNETNACMSDHPHAPPYCDRGNVMPGRVSVSGGVLGQMEYDDYGTCKVMSYELACCGPCTNKTWTCNKADHTCVESDLPSTSPGHFPTQQDCAAKCIAPPPPPLSSAPCIRFVSWTTTSPFPLRALSRAHT